MWAKPHVGPWVTTIAGSAWDAFLDLCDLDCCLFFPLFFWSWIHIYAFTHLRMSAPCYIYKKVKGLWWQKQDVEWNSSAQEESLSIKKLLQTKVKNAVDDKSLLCTIFGNETSLVNRVLQLHVKEYMRDAIFSSVMAWDQRQCS